MKHTFCLALLAASACSTAGRAQTCPETPTRYVIAMPEPDVARVDIDLTLASPYLNIAAFTSEDGATTDSFIENATIRVDGRTTPLEAVGGGAWLVGEERIGTRAHIAYDLALHQGRHAWPFGAEEIGLAFDGGAYLVSRASLMADYGAPDCPVEITFETPQSATPWAVLAPNQYRADSVDAFHNNAFAFGSEFRRFSADTEAGRVVFVSDAGAAALAQEAAHDTAAIVTELTALFGGFPTSNYHIFLFTNDRPEGGAFHDSFAMLHPSPAQPVDALIWRQGFIHEVIHLWLGHSVRPAPGADIEWFKEGFTDYLAIKMLWRMGYIDDNALAEKLEQLMRRHSFGVLMSQGQVRLTEAGAQKAQNRMIIYGSGATLALLLDAEMSERHGPGAFEAMLADLYANAAEPYTSERLLSALNAASEGAAGRLVALFDAGLSPTELPALIEPYGIDMAFMIPDMFELDLHCSDSGCAPAFLKESE